MRIDEAILIMENERPHCGDKFTFTEGELCEAYTLALMALRDLQRAYDERKTIYLDDAMLKVAKVDKNKYADMSDFHDACVDCLKSLPSAHPEIIRCKDCKYYIDNRCYKIKALDDLRGSNDYCSYAERRTDG